jgi:hypothetical protein
VKVVRPKFDLDILRDIGWKYWDPIGVVGPDVGWPADEYDTYLMSIAGAMWNGRSQQEAADYLVKIEIEYMGLEPFDGMQERALRVAEVVDDYLRSIRHRNQS